MVAAALRDTRMQVAEDRAWVEDRPDEERRQPVDGESVPMAPQSEGHRQIVANLLGRLSGLARARDCRAIPGIAVPSDTMDTFAPIPDVIVRCGPRLRDGDARDPVRVAEGLSPPTMSRDRGRKTDFYRSIPSRHLFLIVYQDEARVDVWRRGDGTTWAEACGLGAVVALPELDGTLAVADLYDDIGF
ncbi:Uma2 family endonuclease [Methylobacterium organophilum]|uniref:Uma2 family endonuclease n=1 Tax=Methylobacterium organophilum TaxID=410 RepID=UPI001F13A7E0|nr:Uma2 family endonuclease [Methylobacterium organophilum]UMY19195.1 Uma2 family endonuclease [Methylobacterium organophilum]